MNNSINELRVQKIMELAQREIVPFEHKKSKRELMALCMIDICDGLLHGKFTEEQIMAVGKDAFDWKSYVYNMDFRYSDNEDYFEAYANYLGYKYKSIMDVIPMLDYHAIVYYQASQKVLKLLHKKRL